MYKFISLPLLSSLLVVASCDDTQEPNLFDAGTADANTADAGTVDANPTDAAMDTTQEITLNFLAKIGTEDFACSSDGNTPAVYQGLGTTAAPTNFKDFRLYISKILLLGRLRSYRVTC